MECAAAFRTLAAVRNFAITHCSAETPASSSASTSMTSDPALPPSSWVNDASASSFVASTSIGTCRVTWLMYACKHARPDRRDRTPTAMAGFVRRLLSRRCDQSISIAPRVAGREGAHHMAIPTARLAQRLLRPIPVIQYVQPDLGFAPKRSAPNDRSASLCMTKRVIRRVSTPR